MRFAVRCVTRAQEVSLACVGQRPPPRGNPWIAVPIVIVGGSGWPPTRFRWPRRRLGRRGDRPCSARRTTSSSRHPGRRGRLLHQSACMSPGRSGRRSGAVIMAERQTISKGRFGWRVVARADGQVGLARAGDSIISGCSVLRLQSISTSAPGMAAHGVAAQDDGRRPDAPHLPHRPAREGGGRDRSGGAGCVGSCPSWSQRQATAASNRKGELGDLLTAMPLASIRTIQPSDIRVTLLKGREPDLAANC